MRGIGGYFELELEDKSEHHQNMLRLNSGRSCLEYILRGRNYRRVFVPKYCCDVLLEPFSRADVDHTFYEINEAFEPIITNPLGNDEALLYINYFGVNDHIVSKLASSYTNLIIDNSQAFFSKPLPDMDTFYSPRKFFGVPDGGYLASSLSSAENIEQDTSYLRCLHLLHRIDEDAMSGYQEYRENEKLIDSLPVMHMSKLTHRILCSIDYDHIRKKRQENYHFLHDALASKNLIQINKTDECCPLVYPFLIDQGNILREHLIQNNVYCATYWSNMPICFNGRDPVDHLARNLVALPLDQRLSADDMNRIIELISAFEACGQ